MALLSWSGSVSKGSAKTMTLNKSALSASISAAADGDTYWSTAANIHKAVVFYESTTGSQKEVLTFNYADASPTADFLVSAQSRDSWEVSKVMLFDFDGGLLSISKAILQANVSGGISGLDISFAPVVSGYEAAVLADSPYFYYRFQETSGTSFADSSGNGRTATMPVVGSSLLDQAGPVTGGKSIYFEGTRIQSPLTPSPSTLSIEFWFKGTGPGIGEYWLMTHGDVSGVNGNPSYPTHGAQLRYGAFPSPGWYIQASAYDTVAQNYASSVSTPSGYPGVADNNWHHFVFVQNGQTLTFYIDGAEAVTSSPSFTSLNQSVPWVIGKYLNSTQCIGNIAEVAFYTTALSQARVLAHLNAA